MASAFALLPARTAAMGLSWGGTPPTVSPPSVTSPVAANGAATISCAAQDSSLVTGLSVTVSGGALDGGGTTEALSIAPAGAVTGTATWVAPAAGPATITCSATNSSNLSASSSLAVTVAAPTPSVVIDALTGPTAPVLVGAAVPLQASAHDPSGGTLSYAWSASAGTIQSSGASATLTAPQAAGTVTVTLTVSSTSGSAAATGTSSFSVILAASQGTLGDALLGPHRLARGPEGYLYVVDGQGGLHVLTAKGEPMGTVPLPDRALAVAATAGTAFVSTVGGKILRVDPVAARVVGALDVGYALGPMGLAFDPTTQLLWLAERDAGQLRAIRLDGTTVMVANRAGGTPLAGVSDVAIDAASGLVWVALDYNPGGAMAHAFKLSDASYARSILGGGTAANQVTRAGGIAVDATGRVLVSDVYAGNVQVTSGAGVYLGALGSFGAGPGELRQPAGVLALPTGDVLVANSDDGRLERYGTGASLPACLADGWVDSDCDGMPDAWELAYGLNPYWAGDALLDHDGDGLTNLQEFQAHTNPRLADTDGDGYPDGWELANGFDPTNSNDHRPVVSVSGPSEVNPGFVRLSAVASGTGTCGVAWKQVSGPKLALGISNGSATFVARQAATYAFQAVATCSGIASAPARLAVVVRDVPPVAEPGRIQVLRPGGRIGLDARWSSDANGGALTFLWDQTLGTPVLASQPGGFVTAPERGVGLYGFQVTVTDPAGNASAAEVPVLVTGGPAPTAIAVAIPAEGEVGSTVALDASASFFGTVVRWSQVSGPVAELGGADTPVAWFVPSAAGRYVFEVQVANDELRSPPARVEVFVAEAGQGLPTVTAAASSVVGVGTPVSLEATASGGAVEYAWKQVAGQAAGLNDADRATATAVAFAPGFYVFEVSVKEGAAESRPARVAFEARTAGHAIPRARATSPTPAPAMVGQLVLLDGRGSVGASRYRWTQVAGPWVVLQAPAEAVTAFRPHAPGRYAFELEVDDGTARSAPARVEVVVTKGEVK
ncbi:PKD domain-containing protein [Anaeromyxobacter oryzisoli]|uniref:PKD domain-containing protein n=1 Tax=Anaeromyxobacter oryzisoli TaxID=2925408 RepID=UPI001F56A58D|nr:hypothetical protein [Anaeromyxobacter sp. SG63]